MHALELWRKLCWTIIYAGPHRDLTIDTLNGLLTVDSKDWLIGKYLYVNRKHERDEADWALGLLKQEGYLSPHAKTLINVGANIGMTAIALMKTGLFGQAFVFEPTPNSFRLLVRNISQNGFQGRIHPFQIALSALEGEFDLELSRDNSGDNRICLTSKPGFFKEEARRTIKVSAKTLDGFLLQNPSVNPSAVGLVWVDIQGHEGHFFRGARQFLSADVPVVSEVWPYAIVRSGMSRQHFCDTTAELFSHFYCLGTEPTRRFPISAVAGLFDSYSNPRAMCVVLLLPNRGT